MPLENKQAAVRESNRRNIKISISPNLIKEMFYLLIACFENCFHVSTCGKEWKFAGGIISYGYDTLKEKYTVQSTVNHEAERQSTFLS